MRRHTNTSTHQNTTTPDYTTHQPHPHPSKQKQQGELVDTCTGANKTRLETHLRANIPEEQLPPGQWLYR
jgi:hypothetical protein